MVLEYSFGLKGVDRMMKVGNIEDTNMNQIFEGVVIAPHGLKLKGLGLVPWLLLIRVTRRGQ